MYPSNFRKHFQLLVCAPANQQTKWWQMMAGLDGFFNVNTGNGTNIYDAGG